MQIRKIISIFFINTLLGLILYSYLYYGEIGEFPDFFENRGLLIYIILGSNLIGLFVLLVNSALNKISFWQRKIGLRFVLGIGVNYVTVIISVVFLLWGYLKITNLNYSINGLLEEYNEIKIRVYILVLVLDILFVVFDFLIYSYKYYLHGQVQNAKLTRKQMQLQFEALRTQLSPHYLFNSLNTISSLIYKDENQTEDYIRKLANTYQYILTSDKKQLISLKEEIAFIEDYCFLLKIRFGKSLQYQMDIDENLVEFLIPPISIQILVENAIKHNVFDDDQPLKVDIIASNNRVFVKNKIMKAPASRESFKIGLSNIKNRYQVFTDKQIKVIKDDYFKVELPLLKPGKNG